MTQHLSSASFSAPSSVIVALIFRSSETLAHAHDRAGWLLDCATEFGLQDAVRALQSFRELGYLNWTDHDLVLNWVRSQVEVED